MKKKINMKINYALIINRSSKEKFSCAILDKKQLYLFSRVRFFFVTSFNIIYEIERNQQTDKSS